MSRASIASRLRWSIGLLAVAVLVPTGWLAARQTLAEVNALCDARLAQAAFGLDTMISRTGLGHLASGSGQPLPDVPVAGHLGETPTHEVEVGYQVVDADGEVLLVTGNMRSLGVALAGGPAFRDVHIDRRRWRLYTYRDTAQGITVTAGERYDSRRDVLRALWMEHAVPLLLGIPLLVLALRWSVRRALAPLVTLADLLRHRSTACREVVVLHGAPQEIQPIVDALNGQFQRMGHALERERRFSADVAHELRTPLASTMINLDSAILGSAFDGGVSLPEAYASLQSLAHRTEQLLLLARLEDTTDMPRERVDLCAVARAVVDVLRATHHADGASLELKLPILPVWLVGYGPALDALMRNLVENALRHAPRRGHVSLEVRYAGPAAVIEVSDDGPGIPAERREAVFERFHREATSLGDGFGLGLSIVQRAARLHAASVELLDAASVHGLLVRVTIPF
ncbi:MAG TPA: ATP-binding protein [Luteibacter sp.]|uniref:sensor histidine kinase n=1 Tax=Luteibacter sp. TaxID=1886636 RepID=UPI002C48D92A|nr:ATP-binding protein [Luteibacter sp.]HVI53781.1 ATP-binding protein [Luteibacter sp.]